MKVLVIENASSAPAALFGDWLREHGAELTVVTPEAVPATPDGYDLVVTLGSPHGAYEDLPWIHRQRDFLRAAAEADHPVIGICFGAQLLADAIGGKAAKMADGQTYIGWHENEFAADPLWAGPWLRFHGDHLEVPEHVEVLARDKGTVQAYHYRRALGVQFHPEAGQTQVDFWAAKMPDWLARGGLTYDGLVAESREVLARQAEARDVLFSEMLRRTVGPRG